MDLASSAERFPVQWVISLVLLEPASLTALLRLPYSLYTSALREEEKWDIRTKPHHWGGVGSQSHYQAPALLCLQQSVSLCVQDAWGGAVREFRRGGGWMKTSALLLHSLPI